MWRKTLPFVQLSLFALAAFAGQACFEELYSSYPAPEYYSAGPPVIVGDYDDHHIWHDRNWWVGHNRDWVSTHRHEWLEHHEEHEHRGG